MLEVKTNISFGKQKKIDMVKIGIFNSKPLKASKYGTLKSLPGGIKANKKSTKNFGDKTVAESFESVVKKTRYLRYFQEVFNSKKGNEIIQNFISEPIRALNSIAGLGQQAYILMSKKERNGKKRILQKGHSFYAIGTGETMQSIEGRL